MVTSLYRYRGFIWQSALAELRHRYAGTGMGVVWNVMHPLALIAVYTLVFSGIMQTTYDRMPGRFGFLLYLCSGLLPYLAFSECVTRGCNAFSENAVYLKKLPIPEQVFVAQTAASASLGLLISFSMLILVSLAVGHRPSWHWLLLPIPLIALQLLGFGLGLLCGTLHVFFRDIGQLLPLVLQVVFWTVPIVYRLDMLPRPLQPVIPFHPLYPPLNAIRDLFLESRMPEPWAWAGMAAWPALVLAAAAAAFGRLRVEIRDLL